LLCNQVLLVNYVLAGGGFIGSRSAARRSVVGTIELAFEIQLILFGDDEIAGPDPDHFAAELQGRKPAAEFVAKWPQPSSAASGAAWPSVAKGRQHCFFEADDTRASQWSDRTLGTNGSLAN
jgi:hypothetical protein